jgi:hypothetical protein
MVAYGIVMLHGAVNTDRSQQSGVYKQSLIGTVMTSVAPQPTMSHNCTVEPGDAAYTHCCIRHHLVTLVYHLHLASSSSALLTP